MVKDLQKEVEKIASKYDNLQVKSASWNEEDGSMTMQVAVKGGPNPGKLPEGVEVIDQEVMMTADTIGSVVPSFEAGALRRIDQDPLTPADLDLLDGPSVLEATPQDLYQRSISAWRSKDVYGTSINVLTNFASKGFENDIDDPTIKTFFDSWVVDVGFDDIVEKIFFDFFRVGMVRTYKIMGKYEPKINFLSPTPGKSSARVKKEVALAGNRFTNSFIPIAYTVLNPTMVEIKGSLMFGQTATFLKAKAGEEIKVLLQMDQSKLSTFQKKIIKNLPSDFKKAALSGEDIPLEPDLVGEVDYRRMPYERYPLPRGTRAFEAVKFKDELRKADYSTLDGITNYILKITVGNDNFPVTKQETLERVGEMFDTVSKSFKVVWNHTLNVEKITSPEVGEILGQEKYKQVNEDITGALGVTRAILDGTGGESGAAIEWAIKALIEEINYARRQVARWIYAEYRSVAETMGFQKIPKVRFDDMALRDEIQMMSIVQGMIDRRIISYRTGQTKLGFDPDTELAQMKEEQKLVEDGVLGLVGSPFQQSKQPVQGTPRGTPSEGRPRGKPAKTPAKKDKTETKKTSAEVQEWVDDLSMEEIESLLKAVKKARTKVK